MTRLEELGTRAFNISHLLNVLVEQGHSKQLNNSMKLDDFDCASQELEKFLTTFIQSGGKGICFHCGASLQPEYTICADCDDEIDGWAEWPEWEMS